VLLRRYGGQGAQIQLDAIRTAGTLIVGTGGAVALLLTARRQRYTELTLVHTTSDATERRITELYTKAADQLGSEHAPVRLAGLYALERLAHSTVEHRQTIVDVICAYLRMPYTVPQASASVLGRSSRSSGQARRRRARTLTDRPSHTTPRSQTSRQENLQQEQQVRLTAQGILLRNLRVTALRRRRWWHRTPPPAPAWPGIRLNLTGALLREFSLAECELSYANFTHTKFSGFADFTEAQFTGESLFEGAEFSDSALFARTRFTGDALFEGTQFTGRALFKGTQFSRMADFKFTQFTGEADFGFAQFRGAFFSDVRFTGPADFSSAQFGPVSFRGTQFTGGADFDCAQFSVLPVFFASARVSLA
ncbi:MAG: pentapeptide repeat-containing protein, partial [Mycobacteriales bacterium]